MVQKKESEPKRRGRPRAYDPEAGARARGRHVLEGGLRRDVARRSVGSDRHEPAEPLCGVRRQARSLSQDARPLSRRVARAGARGAGRRSAAARVPQALLRQGARPLSRRRAARLLLDRHGRDGRGGCEG